MQNMIQKQILEEILQCKIGITLIFLDFEVLKILTLKSKLHYNIKLLKGYGISIKQKDNQIHLTDGADPFTNQRETESHYITEFPQNFQNLQLLGWIPLVFGLLIVVLTIREKLTH